jgi:membrane protease YdiL (CAAX protease family)
MVWVGVIVVVTAAALGFALRPELSGKENVWLMWGAVGIPHLALAGLAAARMWQDKTLLKRLEPRWGDLSIGIVVAAILMFGSWGTRELLTPTDSQRLAWLYQVYSQLGSPEVIQRSYALTATILAVAALEEVIWRGYVLDQFNERISKRYGWLVTALLYAATTIPTVFTLADPVAGPNPLLLIAALGCGLFWSFTANIVGRLPPVMISHMVFTYFMTLMFRPAGL